MDIRDTAKHVYNMLRHLCGNTPEVVEYHKLIGESDFEYNFNYFLTNNANRSSILFICILAHGVPGSVKVSHSKQYTSIHEILRWIYDCENAGRHTTALSSIP